MMKKQDVQASTDELDQETKINTIAKKLFKVCQNEKLTMEEYGKVIKRMNRLARTNARI